MLFRVAGLELEARKPAAPASAASTGIGTNPLAKEEPAVRAFVRETLERQGYRVLACENGRQAVGRELARRMAFMCPAALLAKVREALARA